MNILHSALGRYEALVDPAQIDCVIGHAYGTSVDEDSVNRALAEFALANAAGTPIIADQTLTAAFEDPGQVEFTTPTSIATTLGRGDGTWGTLVHAKQIMESQGLRRPLMVAQAHHIGRAVRQGHRLEIESVVLAGLPNMFDSGSEQLFTHSLGL